MGGRDDFAQDQASSCSVRERDVACPESERGGRVASDRQEAAIRFGWRDGESDARGGSIDDGKSVLDDGGDHRSLVGAGRG